MAHTCPECWKICYCQGDWDDIDFGDWYGCECDCQKFPDVFDDFGNDDEAEQRLYTDLPLALPSIVESKESAGV